MSETKKRKIHSAEFKAKVGLEALHSAKTIIEIGQKYGALGSTSVHHAIATYVQNCSTGSA